MSVGRAGYGEKIAIEMFKGDQALRCLFQERRGSSIHTGVMRCDS
tara:strand:+ start:4526 stop:4660 length:135 start_codon:yes stop_codon:yes gene_type:complete